VVVFASAAVYTGVTAPYVVATDVPGGFSGVLAGGAVLVVAGNAVIGRAFSDSVGTVTSAAGLTTESSNRPSLKDLLLGRVITGAPEMSGTVNGREVRATVISKRDPSSTHPSNSVKTLNYTIVSAKLDTPLENGFIIAKADDRPSSELDVPVDSFSTVSTDGQFHVLGEDLEGVAAELLTTRVRNVLFDNDEFGQVTVGDPFQAVGRTVGEQAGNAVDEQGLSDEDARVAAEAVASFMGNAKGVVENNFFKGEAGNPDVVATVVEGNSFTDEGLERRIDVVTTVADAVDRSSLRRAPTAE
jgi:hypothetical protein